MKTPTRVSLLMRLRDRDDVEAWDQFHRLYGPLLYRYARARGLSPEDIEDVRSSCYETIVQQLHDFRYDPNKGRFKAWLRTLVNRRIVDLFRKRREIRAASQALKQLPADHAGPDEIWDEQWKHQHLRYAVEQIRGDVSPQTFKIFSLLVLQGRSVAEVCAELDVKPNLCYKARQRVLDRVREKMREIGYEE